jgi:hypothetical protein
VSCVACPLSPLRAAGCWLQRAVTDVHAETLQCETNTIAPTANCSVHRLPVDQCEPHSMAAYSPDPSLGDAKFPNGEGEQQLFLGVLVRLDCFAFEVYIVLSLPCSPLVYSSFFLASPSSPPIGHFPAMSPGRGHGHIRKHTADTGRPQSSIMLHRICYGTPAYRTLTWSH